MSDLDCNIFRAMFLENKNEIYSFQPYAVFLMCGHPFPDYMHYDVVIIPKNNFIKKSLLFNIKAYDSLSNLNTLGLIKKCNDINYNTLSDRFLNNNICKELDIIMKMVKEETLSGISLQKEIILSRWSLTNAGVTLGNILGLTDIKFDLVSKEREHYENFYKSFIQK